MVDRPRGEPLAFSDQQAARGSTRTKKPSGCNRWAFALSIIHKPSTITLFIPSNPRSTIGLTRRQCDLRSTLAACHRG